MIIEKSFKYAIIFSSQTKTLTCSEAHKDFIKAIKLFFSSKIFMIFKTFSQKAF
jgi:hypothetical protein